MFTKVGNGRWSCSPFENEGQEGRGKEMAVGLVGVGAVVNN